MALNFQNSGDKKKSRIILIVLIVLSILLMTVYSMGGSAGPLYAAQRAVNSIVAPFEFLGTSGGAAIDNASTALGDLTASEETLSALREQNAQLTELVTQSEEYRLEIERLQGLLNLKEDYDIESVTGRVIGHSFDAWNQTVTIDIGTSDGVDTGLTVMGPNGVIGQVVSASQASSVVRLLSDPQSGVSAIVQSNRTQGIVRGSLNGLLHLENIDEDAELAVGDVVLTSGLGGSFTKGLLIGQITQIEGNSQDGTRVVTVSANESISSLEEVMVVLSAGEESSGDSGNDSGDASADGDAGDGDTSDSDTVDTDSGSDTDSGDASGEES